MATHTKEQIEQKRQQLSGKMNEAKALRDELMEAGAFPLDDDELDCVVGGDRKVNERSAWLQEQAGNNMLISDWWGLIPDFAGKNGK